MQTKFKTIRLYLGILFSLSIIFTSCTSDDSSPNPPTPNLITPPTAQQFKALKESALNNRTQTKDFLVDPMTSLINFDSQKGTIVSVNASDLNIAGAPLEVGSTAQFKFTELYSKADLLLTGFGTVGKHGNGDLEMLVTGGAFRTIITQDNQLVEGNLKVNLDVPTSLTGVADNNMVIWDGNFDEQGNLIWEEAPLPNLESTISGIVQVTQDYYYVFGEGMTHINIDRFWGDTSPKTNVSVSVPQGYDNSNSGVFVSFDDILGILWTGYDTDQTKFNTGSIPIGVTCNVVFVSESNGKWVYVIKPYTIAQNGTVEILSSDLNIADSEAKMIELIDALP